MEIRDFIGFIVVIILGILSQVMRSKTKKTSHPAKRSFPPALPARANEPPRATKVNHPKYVPSQRVIPKVSKVPAATKKKETGLSSLFKDRSSLRAGMLMKEILQRPYD
ncbi:MAG: hypothetical protein EBZ47_05680 [Chlamydiae bacterium]|nr:hypothetical protein [Chlamydiota bacterium]